MDAIEVLRRKPRSTPTALNPYGVVTLSGKERDDVLIEIDRLQREIKTLRKQVVKEVSGKAD